MLLSDQLLRGRREEPATKRQKRSDVLDSLGLGGPASSAKAAHKASELAAMHDWLKDDGEDQTAPQAPPAKEQKKQKYSFGFDDDPAPEAVPAASSSSGSKEGKKKYSFGLDDEEPAEESTKSSASDSSASAVPQSSDPDAWKKAFSFARGRWDADEGTAKSRYHLESKDLFFEWDQEAGTLYQYFPEEQTEDGRPGLHPIWSSACPETHAEVWQVLPLPPTDPANEVSEEMEQEAAPTTDAKAQASSPEASERVKEAPKEVAASMLPPAAPAKKRPPVPVLAPPKTNSPAGKDSTGPARPDSMPDDDDEDDANAEAILARMETGATLGCALPPPDAMPPSSKPSSSKAVVDVSDDAPRTIEADEPVTRPPVLDSDDEADLAEGSEPVALPAAPTEKVEPTAQDLDLDIFGAG